MQNKDFFSGVPIEVREFLLRLLNISLQLIFPDINGVRERAA